MHSHDRTLVASLGFRDPDKNEPLHDLACAYLSRDKTTSALVGSSSEITTKCNRWFKRVIDPRGRTYRFDFVGNLTQRVTALEVSKEVPILKGDGKYQTTIGFLDLLARQTVETFDEGVLSYKSKENEEGPWSEPHETTWASAGDFRVWQESFLTREERLFDGVVGVEVKIRPVPVGDLLRQMKLYAKHTGNGFSLPEIDRWVAVLRYDIDDAYRSALEDEGIHPIRLGKSFDDWLAKRKTGPSKLRQI